MARKDIGWREEKKTPQKKPKNKKKSKPKPC